MNIWDDVSKELDYWDDDLGPVRLWLRDDDAITPTSALDKLGHLTAKHNIPATIAVIPNPATTDLVAWVQKNQQFSIAIHGFNHTNHAPDSEKKCELGHHRNMPLVLDELARGHTKLEALFGDQFIPMLVPPWNRIDERLIGQLPELGVQCLSTFSWPYNSTKFTDLKLLNTHIDIIDWKGNRGGRPVGTLATELQEALQIARKRGGEPVGFLSHHLVHDENAWAFLEQLFQFTGQNNKIKWCGAGSLF